MMFIAGYICGMLALFFFLWGKSAEKSQPPPPPLPELPSFQVRMRVTEDNDEILSVSCELLESEGEEARRTR